MKTLQIQNLTEENGCYMQDGKELTNFVLEATKIITDEGNSVQYKFLVYIYEETYTATVSPYQLNKQKFLQKLPVYIENEKEFYKQLRDTILRKKFEDDETFYQTGCNGLQKANGQWMYVYTNGSIDKNGFRTDIYSGIAGAYLPAEAFMDPEKTKEAVSQLFQVYNCNYRIFYPLFFMNLMAITNGYFNTFEEPCFMKLTLWLDGPSGLGKSSLIRSAGAYTFRDEHLNKEFVSATGRRRSALKCLEQASGTVCILDDVKEENVRERKNSIKNIVDDVIRSVFQGRMTDSSNINSKPKPIDTCAIINGEFMDTKESQNARILCLKIQEFLGDKKNLDGINTLQKNPLLLTTVCVGYIQWLLAMMEENSFPELLKGKLKALRDAPARYVGINNAVRLNENKHMMEMATILSCMYFRKIGMPKEFINRFLLNAKNSIEAICDSTFGLLGGEQAVLSKALENVFLNAKIRKAAYEEYPHYYYANCDCKYIQEHFWINQEDDFVWIESYQKSLQKSGSDTNDQYDESPYLIIRQQILLDKLRAEIKSLLEENQTVSAIADKLISHLPTMLKKEQIIFKKYRTDSPSGRTAVNYPVYKIWKGSVQYYDSYEGRDRYKDMTVYNMTVEPVIQMNTAHPYVKTLLERLENETEETMPVDVNRREIKDMEQSELYKTRVAFAKSKSLYKK